MWKLAHYEGYHSRATIWTWGSLLNTSRLSLITFTLYSCEQVIFLAQNFTSTRLYYRLLRTISHVPRITFLQPKLPTQNFSRSRNFDVTPNTSSLTDPKQWSGNGGKGRPGGVKVNAAYHILLVNRIRWRRFGHSSARSAAFPHLTKRI